MTEFISNLIGNDFLATLIMSFIPMIELKGSIVFARGAGIEIWYAFLLSYAGSTLVFFIIFFLLKPILKLLKKIKFIDKFALKLEYYFKDKAQRTLEKQQRKNKKGTMNERKLKMLSTFIFVAIPLPLTGVWTGTAVSVFLDMKFKDAVLPVAVGNFIAGLLIAGLAELCMLIFKSYAVLDYILYGLFGLAVILLIVFIVKVARKKQPVEDEGDL